MHNSWFWQWIMLPILPKVLPIERFALATSVEPFKYHAFRKAVKLP